MVSFLFVEICSMNAKTMFILKVKKTENESIKICFMFL